MIIGIDGNEANIENRVGVNVYAFEVLWGLYRISKNTTKNDNPIIYRVYLREKPRKDMPPSSENWEYRVLPGGKIWILTKLMPDLYKFNPKPSVFFSPSHYVPLFTPFPKVCSIMDLGYLEFSEQFKKYDFWQLKLWSAYSIFISNSIISISTATAKDIVRHYPFASKKIHVTPLAYDTKRFHTKVLNSDVRRIKKQYSIVSDYILFISTLKPSKNIEGLLDAWYIVSHKFPKITLVISGKKGWLYESIFQKVKKLKLEDRILFTDFVPEPDKPGLIAGAKLLVLPSYWEGFGLDVLNALASGVPVVVSNRASLPEVAGSAGVVVDPEKPQNIAWGIEKVLNSSKIDYNKLVQAGLKQAKKFSWDKTAQETLKILIHTSNV